MTLSLTVTSGGGYGNTTWTLCAQSGIPLWVAAQSNGGSWTQVVGVNNVYSFNITTRSAIAWVRAVGNSTQLEIFYGSQAELSGRGTSQCTGTGSLKTINVTAVGVGAAERATVAMGSSLGFYFTVLPNPFQLNNVRDGITDLIGVRGPLTGLPIRSSSSVTATMQMAPT